MNKQPEALRLADELDVGDFDALTNYAAANELTRLHEANAYFQAAYGQELKTSNELRRANQAMLEALGEIEWSNDSKWRSDRAKAAITALQEAPVQRPDWLTENQRIYLAQAWEILDDYALDQRLKGNDGFANGAEASSHEIKAMLAAPQPAQQEPIYQYQMANGSWIDQTKESHDYNVRHGQATVRVVYTSPQAQRTWVGLVWGELPEDGHDHDFLRGATWAEAKLKEKNT